MPLNPILAAYLQQMPAAPQGQSLEEMRANVERFSGLLPRRPVQIAGTRDLTLPGPAGDLAARVYTPLGDGPFGALVFFHGGGFVAYGIETHDQVCRELCAGARCVVVSVAYRLAPETPFPGAVEDAEAAVRWVHDHARELGADPARLAVAGDSAGASLSIAVTLRLRDEGGPTLAAQLLIYPATDLTSMDTPSHRENGEGYFLTRERLQFFGSAYLAQAQDALNPLASPLLAPDLNGLPPALVLTAEYDPLRDEGHAYAERLREAGVPTEYRPGPGLIHGFANLTGILPEAAAIMDEAAAWLRDRLD